MRKLDVVRLLFIQNSGNLLHGSPPLSISSMSAIVTDMASFSVDGHLKLIPKQEMLETTYFNQKCSPKSTNLELTDFNRCRKAADESFFNDSGIIRIA